MISTVHRVDMYVWFMLNGAHVIYFMIFCWHTICPCLNVEPCYFLVSRHYKLW